MPFDFTKGLPKFVPKEDGIFSPQEGSTNSGTSGESNNSFPQIDPSLVKKATWIIANTVQTVVDGGKNQKK